MSVRQKRTEGSNPSLSAINHSQIFFGGVSERLKVPVLKTGVGKTTVGSNPTPSAILTRARVTSNVHVHEDYFPQELYVAGIRHPDCAI